MSEYITFGCGTEVHVDDVPSLTLASLETLSMLGGGRVLFKNGQVVEGLFEKVVRLSSEHMIGYCDFIGEREWVNIIPRHLEVADGAPEAEPKTPEEQKELAKTLIDKLRVGCPKACLAGGALFSWKRGESANDLDFFMYMPDWLTTHEVQEHISGLVDKRVISMSNGMYDENDKSVNGVHKVFRARIDGQECQFICCDCDPMKVMQRFPYSHSQLCWDGEKEYDTDHADMIRDFNIVIKHYEPSQAYKDKIEPRLAEMGYTIASSEGEALDLMMEYMTKRKTGGLS